MGAAQLGTPVAWLGTYIVEIGGVATFVLLIERCGVRGWRLLLCRPGTVYQLRCTDWPLVMATRGRLTERAEGRKK